MDDILREHYYSLVKSLEYIIRNRNIEEIEHIRYLQGYTEILAGQYAKLYPKSRMTKEKIGIIVQAARLHDVGKITMPDFVLHRPGRYSKEELELLKEHTIQGSNIIRGMFDFCGAEYRRICHNVCMYHHEKYDGSGYPFGLKKDKIPVEAQLVGLADMYDVLVNTAIEDVPFTKERAYYMLMNGECGELSPRMKECLEAAKEQLEGYHPDS
ncbi:MAG: HD domain-containing protein [Bacteroidales bacterium]|nr:HD domain-containing protein [Clostridium sp.]MCM1204501.1 HD domain-containing protein [Bacteroidales bacterium]